MAQEAMYFDFPIHYPVFVYFMFENVIWEHIF